MYKGLYDIFSHWFRGGQVYFYSDPHFSDEDMKYIRFNYIGDNEQINRINNKVHKQDTIVILGDIGNKEILKKINGYKVLVLGNHDKGSSLYKDYADEVFEGCVTISDKVILSHEPIECSHMLNIHGHIHGGEQDLDNCHINVCAESIDYRPISWKEIQKSGRLKKIKTIHRVIIDNATNRCRTGRIEL